MAVTDLTVKPQYLYQQYRSEQWLLDFFKLLDDYKQENYYNRITEFIEARDILHSNSDYLTFYTRYLLGIYKPLGSASIANYYDTGDIFDKGGVDLYDIYGGRSDESEEPKEPESDLVYDDSAIYDGTISQDQYITYLRFILNYGYEICNLDYICNFVAAWCKISIEEIQVEYFKDSSRIMFTLPLTTVTSDFVKLTINYNDVMGWPKGVFLDFRVATS